MVELNERQQRFADYYIELGNATEAYIRAGYKEAGARANAARMIANDSVKAYIEERMEAVQNKRIADQEEILEFLTSVVRGEVTEPVAILDGGGRQRIENLTPSVQTRKSAAEQLGKRYAMWTEKQEVDVKGAVQFVDDIGGDEDAT